MKQEKDIKELLEFCIINVDKPASITSFKCADKVRKILGAKKADPFIISINNKGEEFLKVIRNLEKIYNDRFK